MSKETEDILRMAALVAVFLVIIGVALGRIRNLEKQIYELEHAPADTTATKKKDTVYIDNPELIKHYESEKEKVAIEVRRLRKQLAEALNLPPDTSYIHDTSEKLVYLPREFMVYKDTNYRAVVSGVDPRLDSIEVYRTTITQTITKHIPQKPKLFSPYVEGGVSVNARDNKEVMWEAGAGIFVRGKVGAGVNWQHNMQTKQDFIGGKIIITLK